jgi:O-antigen/teichoic acid export membrane protein
MKRELFRKGMALMMLRVVGAGLGVATTALIGRPLGPEGLGLYAYALAALGILAIPVTQGWSPLLLRKAAASRRTGDWGELRGLVRRATHYALAIGVLAVSGALAYGVFARTKIAGTPWVMFCGLLGVVIIFDQASALRMAFLRALDRPLLAQLPENVLRPLVLATTFVAISAIVDGRVNVVHALSALAIASLLAAMAGQRLLLAAQPQQFLAATPRFDDAAWRASALTLALSYGVTLVSAYVDLLVLGLYSPLAQVGQYRVALTLSMLCAMPWQALNLIGGERFAALYSAGRRDELQASARFLTRLAFLVTLPSFAVVAIWGRAIIRLVFGEQFAGSFAPTVVLAGVWLLHSSLGMPRTLLVMIGQERIVLLASVWALGLNLALCFALVPHFGMLGAAAANLASAAAWAGTLSFHCRRRAAIAPGIV